MTVAIVMDFKGATLEQYDEVIQKMGFTPRGKGAPDSYGHWVTKTADGIRVTDVWATKEQFEQFAADQIGPLTASVGITEPPELQFYEVHNYLLPG